METELITQKRYDELVAQQKKLDAEIDAQVRLVIISYSIFMALCPVINV